LPNRQLGVGNVGFSFIEDKLVVEAGAYLTASIRDAGLPAGGNSASSVAANVSVSVFLLEQG